LLADVALDPQAIPADPFITISLSHGQARALHRCSAILSELSERAP
jgi:hypothetical protein